MSDWGQGYLTEVPYTFGYYNEMLPSSIDFALSSKGVRPPSDGKSELKYLELGCGQGLTANIVAALNPKTSVCAVDFHPAHIAGAQAFAREAELTNIQFVEADFAEFGASLGPEKKFDYITLHGILSWVSLPIRAAIINIVTRHLAPGGAVYVSYNALPGAGARTIFHQVFSELVDRSGPPTHRVQRGLALVDELLATGASSIRAIEKKVKSLHELASKENYLAHEYLNANSYPFYCSQVFGLFRESKAEFCASGDLISHVDVLQFDDRQSAFLDRWPNPTQRELAGDLIRDTGFRRDIFVRGPLPFTLAQQQAFWVHQRFALGRDPEAMQFNLTTSRGQVTLPPDLYNPLIEHFAAAPSSLAAALVKPGLAKQPFGDLVDALRVLVGLGALSPVCKHESDAELRERTERFNAAVLARSLKSSEIQYLLSPLLERGVDCGWFEQLLMQGKRAGAPSPGAFAAETVSRHGRRLVADGRELSDLPEMVAFAEKQAAEFAGRRRPLLVKLGI